MYHSSAFGDVRQSPDCNFNSVLRHSAFVQYHCKPQEQKQPLAEVLRGAVGCLKRKETEKVRKKVRPL